MPAGLYARPGFLTAQADASQEGRVYAEGLHSSAHMRMANVPSCSLVLRSSASASAASPIVWQPPTQQTGAGHVRGRAWHIASGRNSMGISILCPPHPWAIPAGHEGMRVWSFVRCLIDSEGQAPGTAPSPGLLPPRACGCASEETLCEEPMCEETRASGRGASREGRPGLATVSSFRDRVVALTRLPLCSFDEPQFNFQPNT